MLKVPLSPAKESSAIPTVLLVQRFSLGTSVKIVGYINAVKSVSVSGGVFVPPLSIRVDSHSIIVFSFVFESNSMAAQ